MSLAPAIEVEPEQIVPVESRRFGPSFEKPCRNRDTIICTIKRCREAYTCKWRGAVPAHEYGTIEYEHFPSFKLGKTK
jgi:hypothetical protein